MPSWLEQSKTPKDKAAALPPRPYNALKAQMPYSLPNLFIVKHVRFITRMTGRDIHIKV